MIILGIETSCDDTALALIETRGRGDMLECRVIESLVHSQAALHSAYGGVYPFMAKREHSKNIVPLLEKLLGDPNITRPHLFEPEGFSEPERPNPLLEKGEGERNSKETANHPSIPSLKRRGGAQSISSDQFKATLEQFRADIQSQNPDLWESLIHADFLKNIPQIDRIAVTEGPGLEPALWVGISFARVLSALWQIPVIPINHMEGHIVGSLLESDKPYGSWQKLKDLPLPSVALLISGGHTELVKIDKIGSYEILGQTKDDAVGEAFDKVARLLGLPYPGGPHISKLAREADQRGEASLNSIAPIKLPRPMINSGDLDFSFSGLKTAVLYAVRSAGELTEDFKMSLAREFEQAITETLNTKLRSAIDKIGAQSIIIGGGVSANTRLRDTFTETAKEYGIPIFLPLHHISGDNALMIAIAAIGHEPSDDYVLKAHGTKRL